MAAQDASGRTYHAIKKDIYALKSWHADVGLSHDGFGTQLERAVRGVKCLRGLKAPAAKMPIELPLLRSILQCLPQVHSGLNLAMYRAAFTLAFACFLRCGEVVHDTFNINLHLSVGSVQFAPDRSYAIVTLPSSKTDPFRQGVRVVAPAIGGSTCPVAALWAVTANRQPSAPLFHLFGVDSFGRSSFFHTLKRCIDLCNVPSANFTGHSFRRGAATWAHRVGLSEDNIKLLGRWSSDCVKRYIDKTAEQRRDLSLAMFKNGVSAPLFQDPSTAWRQF